MLVCGTRPRDELDRSGRPFGRHGTVAVAPVRERQVARRDRGLHIRSVGDQAVEREAQLVLARVLREAQRPTEHAERTGVEPARKPFGRAAQSADRIRKRADRERPHARLAKCRRGLRLEVGNVEPGAAGELDRLEIVVREQLGTVLAPVVGQGLDPSGDPDVALDPVGTRKLPVDGVADERVDERVLRGPEDRRAPVAPEELLAPERAQDPVDRLVVLLRDERAGRPTRRRRPSPRRRGAAPSRPVGGDRPERSRSRARCRGALRRRRRRRACARTPPRRAGCPPLVRRPLRGGPRLPDRGPGATRRGVPSRRAPAGRATRSARSACRHPTPVGARAARAARSRPRAAARPRRGRRGCR